MLWLRVQHSQSTQNSGVETSESQALSCPSPSLLPPQGPHGGPKRNQHQASLASPNPWRTHAQISSQVSSLLRSQSPPPCPPLSSLLNWTAAPRILVPGTPLGNDLRGRFRSPFLTKRNPSGTRKPLGILFYCPQGAGPIIFRGGLGKIPQAVHISVNRCTERGQKLSLT